MPSEETKFVTGYLKESLSVFADFATDREVVGILESIAEKITQAMRRGGKLLVAGNGGSAADAQHIAGEFVSRLMFDREPLPAVALTTDSTALTAIGNDYGYDFVFERQVQALGRPGDVFLAISTSGKSPNVLRALAKAKSRSITTIGFTGSQKGPMVEICDLLLAAPSASTALIQQIHITAAHVICALVERAMFPVGLSNEGV